MPKNHDFSRKILKVLSEKQAISMPELAEKVNPEPSSKKPVYALSRSLKGLLEAGLVENLPGGQSHYTRLTKEGRKKALSLKLDASSSVLNPTWDGKWRIILLDLPESRKSERESLRYLLKKAGFVCLKNSAWISPYPFEFLFQNIKKDLGLSTEMMIFTTNDLDEATTAELFREFF
jgi:phenylacetic acid degradation operon negative regulatory protein